MKFPKTMIEPDDSDKIYSIEYYVKRNGKYKLLDRMYYCTKEEKDLTQDLLTAVNSKYYRADMQDIDDNRQLRYYIIKEISMSEFNATYKVYTSTCAHCGSKSEDVGYLQMEKKMHVIPGTKKKFYACSTKCFKEFRENIIKLDGGKNTSKRERERYHKSVNSDVFGYIYVIHNKKEDKYYVGKSIRIPFVRWEEHMMKKQALANMDITDLTFEVEHVIILSGDVQDDIERTWNLEMETVQKYDSYDNGYNDQMPQMYNQKNIINPYEVGEEFEDE